MRFQHHVISVLATLLVLAGCDSTEQQATLETDEQKASYAIGQNMGGQLEPAVDRLDLAALERGLEDALAGRESAVPQEELQAAMQVFRGALQADQRREAEANREEAQAFLEENAQRADVETTESGLQYEVLEEGDGPRPAESDQVTIHYRGTLVDGTEFDSSYERGEPATFQVGGVVPGFKEGLMLMPVGSTYKLYIPPELGYGDQGSGPVPPNATLIFEIELLSIGEGG